MLPLRRALTVARARPTPPLGLHHSFRRALASQVPTSDFVAIDKLANGVRVATDTTPGHFSAVGIYVDTGSRFERTWVPGESGVSHLIDRLAFKSTANRTADQMQSDIEKVGGNVMCSSSRETIMYQASMFNKSFPDVLSILSDTIINPILSAEELDDQREAAAWEIAEIWNKPEMIIPELLHSVAFQGNTLGNPLLCPLDSLQIMSHQNIQNFMKTWFTPDRIVVAGAGISHKELLDLSNKLLGGMKSSTDSPDTTDSLSQSTRTSSSRSSSPSSLLSFGSSPPSSSSSTLSADFSTAAKQAASHAPNGQLPITRQDLANTKAVYTGGQLYQPRDDLPYTHVYVAFEGLAVEDEDIYALATLQILLGGGGSFSAGGPGKGMYSRLYSNVLNKYHAVDFCAAFHHCYADSGIFGIAASVHPSFNVHLPGVIARELELLTIPGMPGGVTKEELSRAKNQLKSSLMMTLESRLVQVEDVGRQVQVHGRRVSVEEMCEKIDQVDLEHLCTVARRVLRSQASTTPLNSGLGSGKSSVVAMGDLQGLGDIRQYLSKRGLGAAP